MTHQTHRTDLDHLASLHEIPLVLTISYNNAPGRRYTLDGLPLHASDVECLPYAFTYFEELHLTAPASPGDGHMNIDTALAAMNPRTGPTPGAMLANSAAETLESYFQLLHSIFPDCSKEISRLDLVFPKLVMSLERQEYLLRESARIYSLMRRDTDAEETAVRIILMLVARSNNLPPCH